MNRLRCLVVGAVVFAALFSRSPEAYAQRETTGGCAGVGGGDTSAIAAALACGLPPPAAPSTQNTGDGMVAAADQPPLGSSCITTVRIPSGVAYDPSGVLPSHEYVDVTPAVTGNPATGLTATATLVSRLPIGSPTGPTTVAVPATAVKTAAQLNADAAAEAAALAGQINANQQQLLDAATSSHAFGQVPPSIQALLTTAQYTPADFYLPPAPPVSGAQAASEEATTWSLRERVFVHDGRVVRDQTSAAGQTPPVYGPEYCSGLSVAGTEAPTLGTLVATVVPAFRAQLDRVADALWQSFRRGSIVSEPAAGAPTYVGLPTCVGLDTGLPTGSATPNPFGISLPLTLRGTAGALPVTVFGRVSVSIVADGVHWDFHDSSGDVAVHGQDSTDPTPPTGQPTYDAAAQSWPNADAVCTVYHQYRGLSAAPGVLISASEHFHISVAGVYSTGAAAPTAFGYTYEPADSPVLWTSGPSPVYQIEAVPFTP